MDNFTLGGPEDIVVQDIATVTSTGANLCLNLNVNNCEIIVHPNGAVLNSSFLRSFKSVMPEDAMLLLPGKNLDDTLDIWCSDLSRAMSVVSAQLMLCFIHIH